MMISTEVAWLIMALTGIGVGIYGYILSLPSRNKPTKPGDAS